MKNPWLTGTHHMGNAQVYHSVEDQLQRLKHMTAKELRAAIEWPSTGKTVRRAAEKKLRRLAELNMIPAGACEYCGEDCDPPPEDLDGARCDICRNMSLCLLNGLCPMCYELNAGKAP